MLVWPTEIKKKFIFVQEVYKSPIAVIIFLMSKSWYSSCQDNRIPNAGNGY